MGSAGHQLGEGAFSRAVAGPWRGGGVGCACSPPPCWPPRSGHAVSSPLLFNCLETELTAVGTAPPLLVS